MNIKLSKKICPSVNHSTFGGLISAYDFNGHTSMSYVADKIISDWRFDMFCMATMKNKQSLKNHDVKSLINKET